MKLNKFNIDIIKIGFVLAAIISYSTYKSFWWMVLHGILNWFYIIYWSIKYY